MARSGLESMAEAMLDAAAWMIKESFTWWIDTDGAALNIGVANAVRDVTMPITVSVAAAGMIVLGIHMVVSGSHDPLLSVGEGIAKLVFWTVAGTTVLTTLMQAGNAFSGWVLDEGSSRRLGARLLTAFDQPVTANVGLILLLSLLGFLAGLVQWVISLFREGALVILAGCLPLAASGQLGLGTHWLRKVVGWCLALIFWQPAASLVYFAAFAMMENSRGPQEMLVGITMLVIAILALPMLLKLFTWVVSPGGPGGRAGGSSRLATAMMMQQMRSRGGSRMTPGQHARLVDSSLPRQGGAGSGGAPSGGGRGGPPSGSAPSGGSSGSSASKAVPSPRAASPGGAAPGKSSSPWAPPGGVSGGSAASPSAGGTATGTGTASGTGAASGAGVSGGAAAGAGGTAGAAGAGAGGAKAAAVAGPIGAAAAAAVMVSAAGAKAAGRAMTEGADTPPPPPSNSGSRKDAT
ncbi:hypothetical protein H3146_03965 [Streptomyces sp. OF3]|uniref:Type IV secretion system protein n=1 Tax=Streptomyces alkaliterrae TaxID=2213162 RepID=A0A7W3WHM2_9ACTN|nr:hypothetical protein [Streptomyces alkaliterrae]MBB1252531.1 hypothetical protein [Streptomyces alkaliterrae]